jgi:hypothetical protein
VKLKIETPTRETKGYWKRVKRGALLMEEMNNNMSVALCDTVIDFILPYVVEPESREEAKDLLEDLSQDEFQKILRAVVGNKGGGNDTTVPPQNSPQPENTSSQTD